MTIRKTKPEFPDDYLRMPEPVATGFYESRVAPPLPGASMASTDCEDMSQADWEAIKHLALQRFVATSLDTPDGHLAYIRNRTAALMPDHV